MGRGDVWWADLPPPWDRRPVVLVARPEAYANLTWVMVAPISTNIRRLPTVVTLDPEADGVAEPSAIYLDSIQAVHRDWLDTRITRLRPAKMQAVERAIHFALSLQNCSSATSR